MTCWHISFSLIIMHSLIHKAKSLPNFFKVNALSLASRPVIIQKSSYTNIRQEQHLPKMIYASAYQIELHLLIDHMMYDVDHMLYFVLFILLEVEAGDFPRYSTIPSDILLPSFMVDYFQKTKGKSQWFLFFSVSLCLMWNFSFLTFLSIAIIAYL